uniref:torsin-1A-interacting protein 1-like isoform X2 n=1 Tax=Doryrhamphus excisus TaxID=161450 RepID=UPI0025AE9946|nr:torsin-1A-interacting protein 1-like isoform X2 [Doryrhamphus excisus]
MDTDGSEDKVNRPLRRSTRQQSTAKSLTYEATPRGPLKRSKRGIEKRSTAAGSVTTVNGSRNVENDSEDEESPSKKSRLDAEESGDDDNEIDVQKSDLETNEDQEMDVEEDSIQQQQPCHLYQPPKIVHSRLGDVKMSPYVVLGERCQLTKNTEKDLMRAKEVKSSTASTTPTKSHMRSLDNEVYVRKITSMAEYKKKMAAKTNSSGIPKVNHQSSSSGYTPSVNTYTVRQRATNIPAQKENVQQHKKADKKARGVTGKCSTGDSSKGCLHYFCWLLVLLLLLSAVVLLAHKNKMISMNQRLKGGAVHPSRSVSLETFSDLWSHLEARFQTQRQELWLRSRIHLEKHLQTAQPTEPVSLILTSGRGAEKTLSCLAQGLASAFSSALQASTLHIDGASKTHLGSDEVKLDIDRQLQAAFGGSQPAAVIHRLEELPPGSTLIFYRYCDHENAAYKEAFLLFTILLPQDEVRGDLGAVEEMVQDYLKDRLVSSSDQTAFNDMDTDKYGGLWSRISHLVLPVVAEKEVEQNGC